MFETFLGLLSIMLIVGLCNPEEIGKWFAKLMDGFNGAKK